MQRGDYMDIKEKLYSKSSSLRGDKKEEYEATSNLLSF